MISRSHFCLGVLFFRPSFTLSNMILTKELSIPHERYSFLPALVVYQTPGK